MRRGLVILHPSLRQSFGSTWTKRLMKLHRSWRQVTLACPYGWEHACMRGSQELQADALPDLLSHVQAQQWTWQAPRFCSPLISWSAGLGNIPLLSGNNASPAQVRGAAGMPWLDGRGSGDGLPIPQESYLDLKYPGALSQESIGLQPAALSHINFAAHSGLGTSWKSLQGLTCTCVPEGKHVTISTAPVIQFWLECPSLRVIVDMRQSGKEKPLSCYGKVPMAIRQCKLSLHE